jgi:molecular chaperone DnaJ
LRYDMEVTLEEAFHGKTAEINVEVSQTCEPCKGTGATPGTSARRCNLCGGHGKVRAQQGFFMVERACPNCHGRGEVIEKPCRHCRGEGRVDTPRPGGGYSRRRRHRHPHPPGRQGRGRTGRAPAGDLYIFLHIARHKVFERDGTTLLTRAPISFTTAALGGEIEIPGLDGSRHTIEIPPASSPASSCASAVRACPCCRGAAPAIWSWKSRSRRRPSLSARQRELLREFQSPKPARNARNPRVFRADQGCLDRSDRMTE